MEPSKDQIIASFDPNSPADTHSQIFGLPFSYEHAEIILLPVPWEVTVSYRSGTALGPQAIRNASFQVDLYDPFVREAWKNGIYMLEESEELKRKGEHLRKLAHKAIQIQTGEIQAESDEELQLLQDSVNKGCEEMIRFVYEQSLKILNDNKTLGLIGGDHSTPLGLLQALAEKHSSFGILQLDAHADLRYHYEGFAYSHASIMYNALKIPNISRLIQVGIRDYCEEEVQRIQKSSGRIKTFFDRDIKYSGFRGDSWDRICNRVVKELPDSVYLSFDIDALNPSLCPNTGTPVAGGFTTDEVLFLLEKIVLSGKKIIAFDLNEVSPGDGNGPDADIAARMLYRICNLVHFSQKRN